MREGGFYNRQAMFRARASRDQLQDQHRQIFPALLARQPEAAQAAVVLKLHFVEAALSDQRRAARNEDVARLRLEQEQNRQAQ